MRLVESSQDTLEAKHSPQGLGGKADALGEQSADVTVRRAVDPVQCVKDDSFVTDLIFHSRKQCPGENVEPCGRRNGPFELVSHALGVRLSPLQIKAATNPRMTLEQYWQEKKCLAVWDEDR